MPLAGKSLFHFPDSLGRRVAFWLCMISALIALSWMVMGLANLIGLDGWMHPLMNLTHEDTHRLFQLINFLVAVLLLGLTVIIFLLKRRLDQKIKILAAAHQKLLDQSGLLRLATEATPIGIWDLYPQEESGTFSQQWYAMFGYPPNPNPVPISEFQNWVHPDDIPAAEKALATYMRNAGQGQFEAEMRIRRVDGVFCWVLAKGRCIAWDDKGVPTRIIGLHLNIQTIKEAHEELTRSEARFRAIFESAPFGIIINNLEDGRFLDANQRFLEQLELSREVLLHMKDRDFKYSSDKKIDEVRALLIEKNIVRDVEGSFRKKDETIVHFIYSSVLVDLHGQKQVISMFMDNTDRKRVEEERGILQEQLHQSQKLEAIAILAGGVAHDFNNMLGAIIGYTELTLSKMSVTDPFRENLGRILDAAQRSAGLTRQLLAFARKQAMAPVVFDLNESVENMLTMLRRLIGENIGLVWLPGKGACTIKMDPSQLDQVLANLCINGKDAISDVGKITIETATVSIDSSYGDLHAGVVPGRYLMLSVSDDGCGIDKNTIEHIFEPFFTTKGLGHGTGLGLSTVYGIVKQNQGFIDVYSEPGKGTTFKLYFPFFSEQTDAVPKVHQLDLPRSKGETILVVEDDPGLLNMIIMMLQHLGYSVQAAASPGEAVALAEQEMTDIHLCMSDLIMPEMNGRDLCARIQQIRPGIKLLFMTGYTANIILYEDILDNGLHFIQKPFVLKDLAFKIREVLVEEGRMNEP
jgi:PAS domain S-box-containing protein